MRLLALWTFGLAGKSVPTGHEIEVPTHLEGRAQRLIDNGSAALVNPLSSTEGGNGEPTGAGTPAPVVEPVVAATTVVPGGGSAAHTGGTEGSTDTSATVAAHAAVVVPAPDVAPAPAAKAVSKAAPKPKPKGKSK